MIIFSEHHQKILILMTRYIEKYLNNENVNNENVIKDFHYLFVNEIQKKHTNTQNDYIQYYTVIFILLFIVLFITRAA